MELYDDVTRLQLLELAFQHSRESIMITDAELDLPGPCIIYVNPSFETMTGYSAAEVIGQTPRILQGPATDRLLLQNLRASLEKGDSFQGETINYRKDGRPFINEWTIDPVRNTEGQITHFVAVQRDITERKQVEEELQHLNMELESRVRQRTAQLESANYALRIEINERIQAAQRNRALLDAIPDALLRVSRNGTVLDYLPAKNVEWLFLSESVVGQNIGQVLPTTMVQQTIFYLDQVMAYGIPQSFEFSVPQRLGDYLLEAKLINSRQLAAALTEQDHLRLRGEQVLLGDLLIRNGLLSLADLQAMLQRQQVNGDIRHCESRMVRSGKDEVLIIIRDITARKLAEQNLSTAYTRMAELNIDLQRSRDLMRTLFDGLGDGLLLLDNNGMILAANQTLADMLGNVPFTPVDMSWMELCQRISPGFPNQSILNALDSGSEWHCREGYTDPWGRRRILDIHTLPITGPDQKIDRLIVHIIDVTERLELEAMAIQNERLLASGKLAAMVAHEVNTPLQSIQHCLYLADTPHDTERSAYLKLATEEIGRVSEIVNRLLDLYRPRQGVTTPIDIHALLERVLLLTNSLLAQNSIVVERDFTPLLPNLPGRADYLTQVLLNLIINAVDAMPTGGTLRLHTRYEPQPNATLIVSISDTGQGISPAIQARIFEPFFTTKSAGSGIGLAICKIILEQHGGDIQVQSVPGVGSTFTLHFPLNDDRITEAAAD